MSSKEKVVKAEAVLAAGPQPSPIMETTLITLMHLVLHSEKIELEVLLFPTSRHYLPILFYYLIEKLEHWVH